MTSQRTRELIYGVPHGRQMRSGDAIELLCKALLYNFASSRALAITKCERIESIYLIVSEILYKEFKTHKGYKSMQDAAFMVFEYMSDSDTHATLDSFYKAACSIRESRVLK